MNMHKFSGEDLLTTFNDLNIDLRNLSVNVIRAWFDTDCGNTRDLLDWLCFSLSSVNYVSPLEKAEYHDIEVHLSSKECLEGLTELNPSYLSIFDSIFEDQNNFEELLLIQDEIELLEDDNKQLDKLINIYENLDSNISLDLTHQTQREIQSKVECKQLQETCESLSKNLDESYNNLQKNLTKYDPDSHLVNFIDPKDYNEDIENIDPFLELFVDVDQTFLEKSDERFSDDSDDLETYRKRILHAHQIYFANKVEAETFKGILEFLNNTKNNINDHISSWNSLNVTASLPAKNHNRKRMCDILDNMASKVADNYIKQTRVRYLEQEHAELQQKYENVSKILGYFTKHLSYYGVMNCLQFEEKKDVECINSFYQTMITYINEDLYKCRVRTEQMRRIAEDYTSYQTEPTFERSKLISSIVKVLTTDDDHTLKSAADAVGKFKAELNRLETRLFYSDFKNDKEVAREINENISALLKFLISGPTDRVVFIPLDLQEGWCKIEERLKRESASIAQAVQVPQIVKKATTKAQSYTRQLWTSFLTDPSKVDSIIQQAEEEFEKRTRQYFS